ncbi:hypothetical protein [Actinomadura vinacea]
MNTSTIDRTASRSKAGVDADTSAGGHPFDIAETTFRLLTRGPSPLSMDGALLGHGLPARVIPLDELRSVLLHPSTGHAARDAVWKELVIWARQKGGVSWVMACVGLALPGLKAVVRDDLRAYVRSEGKAGSARVAGELLVAFHDGLLRIDIERPKIAQRLLWRSAKAVERAYRVRVRVVPVEPAMLAQIAPRRGRPEQHVDLLMDAAVRQGTLTRLEAEIVIATRLEGVAPDSVAKQLGIGYEALMKRRRRAEERLVAAMRDGGLREDFADLMSDPGA